MPSPPTPPAARPDVPAATPAPTPVSALALLLLLAAGAWPGTATGLAAQPAPGPEAGAGGSEEAARVASLLDLASMEYGHAVEDGRVVSEAEYAETRGFTRLAEGIFADLAGDGGGRRARLVAARLDSLAAVVEGKGPASRFRELARRVGDDLEEGWGAVPVPEPGRRPSAARGAVLYRRACAACHGAGGAGDGRAAPGMEPPPADLTSDARRREATAARDYQVTVYGIPETAMPASRDWLSPEEAWDLVAYLQTLRFDAGEVAEGRALALEAGDPVADSLRRWSSPGATARLTDDDLAARVRSAWPTGAAAGRDSLTSRQARSVVAYLRTLLGTPLPPR